MKDLKIGKIIIKVKAIIIIAFCLFLNGSVIGAVAAHTQVTEKGINSLLIYILIFLPYIIMFKSIKNNITELEA
ncbi:MULTISPECIES: hypothetical protein [Sphingobacterium]|uniref:hypothetical protein n=1 Tax=Sphingobacterium TaxID=28453 RepID=UPI000B48AAB6|nr:hypothetical protein [Sphingobacterium sp. G1-14]